MLINFHPTIARWTSQDPVKHYSFSTYSAFDNNPVYWSDPSGVDSQYSSYYVPTAVQASGGYRGFSAYRNNTSYHYNEYRGQYEDQNGNYVSYNTARNWAAGNGDLYSVYESRTTYIPTEGTTT